MTQSMAGGKLTTHHWPPLVYFLIGGLGLIFWLGGTSIQVLTSEAWYMGQGVQMVISPLLAYTQIFDFITGHLAKGLLIPYTFSWGVQMATLIASVGVELPRDPWWRFWGCVALLVILIGVNSCGDYQSAAPYGGWGQLGFTAVVLFLTFVVGLLSINMIATGIRLYRGGAALI